MYVYACMKAKTRTETERNGLASFFTSGTGLGFCLSERSVPYSCAQNITSNSRGPRGMNPHQGTEMNEHHQRMYILFLFSTLHIHLIFAIHTREHTSGTTKEPTFDSVALGRFESFLRSETSSSFSLSCSSSPSSAWSRRRSIFARNKWLRNSKMRPDQSW